MLHFRVAGERRTSWLNSADAGQKQITATSEIALPPEPAFTDSARAIATAPAPFGGRDCVRAMTVRASHSSRSIEQLVIGIYERQRGDRSSDLNRLPKASCRHRNTLVVVFP
jgi:hypothetical protein